MERSPIGMDPEAAKVTESTNQDLDDIFGMLFGFDSQQSAIDSVIRYKDRLSLLIARLPELQERCGPIFTQINLTKNYLNAYTQTNALLTIKPGEIDKYSTDGKTGSHLVAFPLFTEDGIYVLSYTIPLKLKTYEDTYKGWGPWKRKVQDSQEPEWVRDDSFNYRNYEDALRSVLRGGLEGHVQTMAIIGTLLTGELDDVCFHGCSFEKKPTDTSVHYGKLDLFDSRSPEAPLLYALINGAFRESRLYGRRVIKERGHRAESAQVALNAVEKKILSPDQNA